MGNMAPRLETNGKLRIGTVHSTLTVFPLTKYRVDDIVSTEVSTGCQLVLWL